MSENISSSAGSEETQMGILNVFEELNFIMLLRSCTPKLHYVISGHLRTWKTRLCRISYHVAIFDLMNTGYRIKNQSGVYFITLTVVDWIDLFTRDQNRKILIDTFEYCRKVKGLKLYAYVIMTNHVHFIGECNKFPFSDFLRDFKRHTTKLLLESIKKETESREAWIRHLFLSAGQKLNKYDVKHQVWKQDNHAIELESPEFTLQKMGYIHENPVRVGFVDDPNAWVYSSQRNYVGLPAILEIDLLDI